MILDMLLLGSFRSWESLLVESIPPLQRFLRLKHPSFLFVRHEETPHERLIAFWCVRNPGQEDILRIDLHGMESYIRMGPFVDGTMAQGVAIRD